MNILQTTDLKKYYGTEPNITKALDGVTLSIEEGEFVAIVGTSGSGKSTLLNMMGGLDTPTSGSIKVKGKELSKLKDEQLMYCFGKAGIIGVFLSYCLPHWEQRYIFRYTQPLEKWFLMQLFTILYFLCWLSQLLFYWSAWQLPS